MPASRFWIEAEGDRFVMLLKGSLHWRPSTPPVVPQSMELVGGGAVQESGVRTLPLTLQATDAL